jgi:two-component system torCAD operon response regulator TorR
VQKLNVIAVDHELAIHGVLTDSLSAEGYRIKTVGSMAAFRRLENAEIADLYLIDLTLPDGNGLSLVKELRLRRNCGIIVLSNRSSEADHVLGLEMGADDYIVKPFRIRELVARVGAVMRRRAPVAGAANLNSQWRQDCDFSFDGYRVSCAARQVIAPGGEAISLTTAEFDLLIVLLRCRGHVCNRDRLLSQMKGNTWNASDRAIDGLVSRLRRKLPVVNGKTSSYIRTVHGVGYAFVA